MWMIISVEHDQSREARGHPTAFTKIRNRASRSAPTENHRILFDVAREHDIDTSRPAAENLAIPRAFDIQDELAGPFCLVSASPPRPSVSRGLDPFFLPGATRILRTLSEFGCRLRSAPLRTFGQHRSEFSLPGNDCHPRLKTTTEPRERKGREVCPRYSSQRLARSPTPMTSPID